MIGFFQQTDDVASDLDLVINALNVVYEGAFDCRLDIPQKMQWLDSVFSLAITKLKETQSTLDKLTESIIEYERSVEKKP
jgi:hypothetical protein